MEVASMSETNRTVLDTVLIVRHGGVTSWEKTSYRLQKGELGIGYLPNGNVIVKSGVDGIVAWKDCPQVEGILEKDLILTHNFGRHTTENGWVDAGGKDMTVMQWLEDALYTPQGPEIVYPDATLTAQFVPAFGEAGTKITKITWDGTYTDGSYEFGTNTDNTANSAAGTTVTWVVKDANGNQIGTAEDNSDGWSYSAQMGDTAISYKISASAICQPADDNLRVPYNNIGKIDAQYKIKGFDAEGTAVKEIFATAKVTGYRKPFWAALTSPLDLNNLTSGQVRGLASGLKTKGLPTSLPVPAGTRQVVFFAKAGEYNNLVAEDKNAGYTKVSFDKKAKAVAVEGANGYKAVDYDMWAVTWDGPIASAKNLELTWS
jgi:hypothetical protein